MKYRLAAITALVLAGCTVLEPSAPELSTRIQLAIDGISVVGTDQQIGFGRSAESAIASMTALAGGEAPETFENEECGAGPMTFARWSDAGVTLNFMDGSMVGYTAEGSGLGAASGISVGTPRTAVTSGSVEIEETTLGWEFETAGVFGLIEGSELDAPVTLMFSGTTCFFR